jgi:hypothetical protein
MHQAKQCFTWRRQAGAKRLVESFSCRLRDEFLYGSLFTTPLQVRPAPEHRPRDCNNVPTSFGLAWFSR